MRTAYAALLGCLTLAACAPRAPWTLELPVQGDTPAARHVHEISSYDRAATAILQVFERDLGFPAFPANLRFYPGRAAFEAALLDSGYDPALARVTAGTMSAIGGYRQVLLNESALYDLSWPARVGMLAHELTHSLQYEWGGGVRGMSDQWLREGFAEWVAARVLEQLGAIRLEDVRRRKREEVRRMGGARLPRLDEMAGFEAWVTINDALNAAPYTYAFVAADLLVERHGVPAVIRYFQLFARSPNRVRNFELAFGESLAAFEGALRAQRFAR